MAQIRVIQVDFTAEEVAQGAHNVLMGTALGQQPMLPPAPPAMPPSYGYQPQPEAWSVRAMPVPPTAQPIPRHPTLAQRLWWMAMDNWVVVLLAVFFFSGGALLLPHLIPNRNQTEDSRRSLESTPTDAVEPFSVGDPPAGVMTGPDGQTPSSDVADRLPPPPATDLQFPAIPQP